MPVLMEVLGFWPKLLPASKAVALLCGKGSRWCQTLEVE